MWHRVQLSAGREFEETRLLQGVLLEPRGQLEYHVPGINQVMQAKHEDECEVNGTIPGQMSSYP